MAPSQLSLTYTFSTSRHLLNEIVRYKQAAKEAQEALQEAESRAARLPPSDSELQQKIAQLTQVWQGHTAV